MTAAQHQIRFETKSGAKLPLQDMKVSGVLHNAFAVIELLQVYRNDEPENIEAVYSFPLAVESTLLHMSMRLNEKVLTGQVTERNQAEARYEEAIAAGDSAVMLEQIEPGLYTMNVGNLMTGEKAEIVLRYALPLKWDTDLLRVALPTTIAPRYGNPSEAGLQPHQVPETDLLTEHRYSLSLEVMGALGDTEIGSPTHAITTRRTDTGVWITLADKRAYADRDLVLTLRSSNGAQSGMAAVRDGDGFVAHSVFGIPKRDTRRPVAVKILVDCSGSMAGDSMTLARAGTLYAIDQLKKKDRVSVSAFGDAFVGATQSHSTMVDADSRKVDMYLRPFASSLEANMGGTNLMKALQTLFGVRYIDARDPKRETGDVLLITDGEVWDREEIVRVSRASNHRIFIIGVGSCPAEALVREIAEATGGAATFVSPKEDVRLAIDRHLHRMRSPRVVSAALEIVDGIDWQSPATLEGRVFPGDTLHVFSGLRSQPDGGARLKIRFADGTSAEIDAAPCSIAVDSSFNSELARLGAAARIKEGSGDCSDEDTKRITRLALDKQILSRYTNYIFVHLRDEDASKAIPELRQVPSMLAAGWGGTGSVAAPVFSRKVAGISVFGQRHIERSYRGIVDDSGTAMSKIVDDETILSVRSFLGSNAETTEPSAANPRKMLEGLNAQFSLLKPWALPILAFDGTDGLALVHDLDMTVLQVLFNLKEEGWAEGEVIVAFWFALLRLPISKHFNRAHRRAVLNAARKIAPLPELVDWLAEGLAPSTDDEWGWDAKKKGPAKISQINAA